MSQTPISQLFSADKPLLSVEFFPPKTDEALEALMDSVDDLAIYQPDFVSVTYGAGGSTRDRSAQACNLLREDHEYNIMPHLTCVGASRDELAQTINGLYETGYRNIMALRGDAPKDADSFVVAKDGFAHASDLVAFIKELHPDIAIGVAGYPEKHPEAPDLATDLRHLKTKVDAGASFITTQLFFDNGDLYRFLDEADKLDISVPVIPGIMPVMSLKQIKRITSMCGASLPAELEKHLNTAGDDSERVRQIGIRWATEQIQDLIEAGLPGVHLYALNRSDVATELMSAFRATAEQP
ncbi:methylenetetrahydrofolate reductase [NAD(P)H] [Pelagicoccus sp. NFK12]|uniref:Methylenetetrahydrofolate reductase n=1 Tax=Pelagicoccus enzymogenes TaxID=2773457 RepID=A0A927FB17_9BACT|nr:methylenetetrahydrofolate reductase [NAD(P)H] [Pelagicoccus enzymogenes]MBD5780501.1 methylenetetrahydrofolate reductase [NAD(P)H] [Pelagicoccus enzymogenes]MDQ8197599.1 methylenetetrahydrofolate reductase [NAD(P)H] [Pelagicoccus enzymogenes]